MWWRLIAGAFIALAPVNAVAEETVKVGLILPMTGPFTTTGKQVEAGARFYMQQNGAEATTVEILRTEDIAPGFDALKGRAEALYVCTDPLVVTNRARIHTLAMSARLPTIYNSREYVEAGGLMSFGPSFLDLWRRTAEIVDKILHGAKPGDIPVEQPTKFDLVINLTTAKALGLEVSPTLLARADEVIE